MRMEIMNNKSDIVEVYNRFSKMSSVEEESTLLNKILMTGRDFENEERLEAFILDEYHKSLIDGVIPVVDDISEKIFNYNAEIIHEIALINILKEERHLGHSESELADIIDEDSLEIEESLLCGYDYIFEIENFTYKTLKSKGLCFYVSEYGTYSPSIDFEKYFNYLSLKDSSEFVANDCQNLLISKLATDNVCLSNGVFMTKSE